MEALGERGQALHALRTFKERRRPCHEQVETGISPGIKFIQQLAQRVQSLLASIGTHALQGLSFIENKHQAGPTAVTQDGEQPCEKMHRAERIKIALHARGPLHGGGYIGLATEPGYQPLGQCCVFRDECPSVGSQHGGECRGGTCNPREPPFHQCFGRRRKRGSITGFGPAFGEHFLLQRVEPTINCRAQRTVGCVGCCQTFDQATINCFPSMQWGFRLGDLYLGGGEASSAGTLLQPTGKEGLSRSVFPAYRLETTTAAGDCRKFQVHGRFEPIHANRKSVQSLKWHRSASKRVENSGPPMRADHGPSFSWNCVRSNRSSSTTSSPSMVMTWA